jgi:hypothetical protein
MCAVAQLAMLHYWVTGLGIKVSMCLLLAAHLINPG